MQRKPGDSQELRKGFFNSFYLKPSSNLPRRNSMPETHVLLEETLDETKTLCGLRVPALWDDLHLDTWQAVNFSADGRGVTCRFCRAKVKRIELPEAA
jgi:hypothetical protein